MQKYNSFLIFQNFLKAINLDCQQNTVDMLAQKLGLKRYNVSIAINRCTQKNFNTLINEYRIKEAILSLSNKKFTVDQIAFDCGFSDRKSFYRIFKKITGLSPTEFRNNVV